jgi:thiol-disulfide isomerase/thioredoxin
MKNFLFFFIDLGAMIRLLVLVVVALQLCCAHRVADLRYTMTDLTDDTYLETTSSGQWLVIVFAPWCGHCKAMLPKLTSSMSQLDRLGVRQFNVARIDGTKSKIARDALGVRGYPTQFYVVDGHWHSFSGYEFKTLAKFNAQLQGDAVRAVDGDVESIGREFWPQLSDRVVSFALARRSVDDGDWQRAVRAFGAAARRWRHLADFYAFSERSVDVDALVVVADGGGGWRSRDGAAVVALLDDVPDAASHKVRSFEVYVDEGDQENEEEDDDDMYAFVERNMHRLVHPLTAESHEYMTKATLCALAVVDPNDARTVPFVEELKATARRARHENITYMVLDAAARPKMAEKLGQTSSMLPSLVLLKPDGHYFHVDHSLEPNADAFEAFFARAHSGQLEQHSTLHGFFAHFNYYRYVVVSWVHGNPLSLIAGAVILAIITIAVTKLSGHNIAGEDPLEVERRQRKEQAQQDDRKRKGKHGNKED